MQVPLFFSGPSHEISEQDSVNLGGSSGCFLPQQYKYSDDLHHYECTDKRDKAAAFANDG
ncbi:MAG TPA: hypothetical protein EYN06_06355 [Myxococcales bacterium]|nr:hypothetical protein [Myxococcales bacterium]HIN86085.1 hypothetical protein [Myxococcales bacterium]